jgi:hypothetical protein
VPAFYRHLLVKDLYHEACAYRRAVRYHDGEALERLQTLITATKGRPASSSPNALQTPPRIVMRPALDTSIYSDLKQLTIQLSSSAVSDRTERLISLRRALRLCKNLETLAISVKSSCHHQPRGSCLAALLNHGRPLLPKLHTLSMHGLTTLQNDLLKFLAAHAKTLRDLRLSEMTLISPRNDSGKPSCWVATIKHIKTTLKLERIFFQNWFCNGAKQLWYISPNDAQDPRRILPAMQKYVTDPSISVCPLEQAAVTAYNEDESVAERHRRFEGDWTWVITTDFERRRYGLNETFSGNYLFGVGELPKIDPEDLDFLEQIQAAVLPPDQGSLPVSPQQQSYLAEMVHQSAKKKLKVSHDSHHDFAKSSHPSWGAPQIFGFTTNFPVPPHEDTPMANSNIEAAATILTDFQYVPLEHALPLSGTSGSSTNPGGASAFGTSNEVENLTSLMSFLSDDPNDPQNELLPFHSPFELDPDSDLWQ